MIYNYVNFFVPNEINLSIILSIIVFLFKGIKALGNISEKGLSLVPLPLP